MNNRDNPSDKIRENQIITIDGPAASGKSTIGKILSQRINFVFVSSGEMYRAFTWHVSENLKSFEDNSSIINLLNNTSFSFKNEDNYGLILINSKEVSKVYLNLPIVNDKVSQIAKIPEVRKVLTIHQRNYLEKHNIVMEGRDIGSIVFPNAKHKFYINASIEVREARRKNQGIKDNISNRDKIDSKRIESPLVIPKNAHVIDSSNLSINEVVEIILKRIKSNNLK